MFECRLRERSWLVADGVFRQCWEPVSSNTLIHAFWAACTYGSLWGVDRPVEHNWNVLAKPNILLCRCSLVTGGAYTASTLGMSEVDVAFGRLHHHLLLPVEAYVGILRVVPAISPCRETSHLMLDFVIAKNNLDPSWNKAD